MRLLFLLTSVVIISSCSSVRDQIGLARTSPDEFKVVTNAPLEIPPSLSQLPPPRPGASRPQERSVVEQAETALLGNKTAAVQPSEAEARLLLQAGADQAAKDIREVIDQEYGSDDTSNKSVTQRLLGIGNPLKKDKSVINPEEEAKRIEKLRVNE